MDAIETQTVRWWKVGPEGVTVEPFEMAPACVPLDRNGARWFRRKADAVALVRGNLESAAAVARSVLARAENRLATFNADHAGED